ncbi:MAG TPA: rod shape-determining protein MreC [Kofleriaceae bacterium]|jgi:rod shape-determining protein MreC|nr:rod shape-determining protein MreC [Kofleriaceae bacterium]
MTSLRRRILDYTLAGLLLLLPVVILRSSLKDPENLNGFDRAVLRVSSPLQSAVSWMIEGIGGAWQRYIWLVNVEGENDELRADNLRLRRLLAEARRAQGDQQVLEKLLALRDKTPSETRAARVVGASMNQAFRVTRIRIDRDAAEVAQDMPVIDADGAVVGKIFRHYGDYSDVLLLTDGSSWVNVQVQRTGKLGHLGGRVANDSLACRLYGLSAGDVEVGDVVVTSGVKSKFPAGLLVGTVSAVSDNPVDTEMVVEVAPAADFDRLTHVLVLTASPPPPDPDDGKPATAQPAMGVFPR